MRLALSGGRIVDPAAQTDQTGTLLIEAGRIAGLLPQNAPVEADQVVDVTGLLVLPGLIDIHAHAFVGETVLGLPADQIGVDQGVTTVVDAGSAGAENLSLFRAQAEQATTRVLAFLNIARDGLARERRELSDPAYIAPEETINSLKENADLLVGIKARASASVVGNQGIGPIRVAKETARRAGVPLMVHIGNAPPPLTEVLDLLEAGDVVSHAFHGKQGGIYGPDGLILEARAALERGVLFDVAHGQSSFSYATARRYLGEGRRPDIISSDLWQGNHRGPVFSLLHTMTKLLHLGMSLMDVVAAATWNPARAMHREAELGSLKVGVPADVSVVRLAEGEFSIVDSEGITETAKLGLEPVLTLRDGRIVRGEV